MTTAVVLSVLGLALLVGAFLAGAAFERKNAAKIARVASMAQQAVADVKKL